MEKKISTIFNELTEINDINLFIEHFNNNINTLKSGLELNQGKLNIIYPNIKKCYETAEGNFFLGLKIKDLHPSLQEFIKINISYTLKLNKRGIRNYINLYEKESYTRYSLKALELFKILDNPKKELLENNEKVLFYLYKAYNIKQNKIIIEYLKEYFDKIFSLSFKSEKMTINNLYLKKWLINKVFLKNENYQFFLKKIDFKNYIQEKLGFVSLEKKQIITTGENQKFYRSSYVIGVIIGNLKSYKSFKREVKKKNTYLKELGLNEKNFIILTKEFKEQQRLNVKSLKSSLQGISRPIDFIICFETDHKTKFHDELRNNFPSQITILDKKGQHFSNISFKNLIIEGIEKYERSQKNNNFLCN